MRKDVYAADPTHQGVIEVQTYQNDAEVLPKIEEILQRWRAQHPADKKPSVFLLCRYGIKRAQGAQGLSEDDMRGLSTRWADRIEMHKYEEEEDEEEAKKDENQPLTLYMTMHKAKGLQAD